MTDEQPKTEDKSVPNAEAKKMLNALADENLDDLIATGAIGLGTKLEHENTVWMHKKKLEGGSLLKSQELQQMARSYQKVELLAGIGAVAQEKPDLANKENFPLLRAYANEKLGEWYQDPQTWKKE
jgi:hypothetical protein